MEFFLERIDGLSSEDLTTELLGYFLSSPCYAPYQRLFYTLIFPNQELNNTEERQFEITTQRVFESSERPDLVIEGEKEIIFIENKFYASFSGGNQMYVYYFRLINNFEDKNKRLVLLTIKDRTDIYLKDMRHQFGVESNQELYKLCSEKGVEFKVVTWEDIFKLFDVSDMLIANLTQYIRSKYLTSTILNEKEIAMLGNQDIPVLLNKLWAGIDKIKDMLASDDYVVTRTSQSRTFYAFRIERIWGMVWVSYDHYCWDNYKTPYVLQLRKRMVKESYQVDDLEFRLSKIGFVLDKAQEYLYPINITEADLSGNAAEIAKEKIKQMDELFESVGKGK